MKKLWWMLPVALLAAGSLVFLGCPNGGDDDKPPVKPGEAFEFDDIVPLKGCGTSAATVDDDGWASIEAGTSTGLYFEFADIKYTPNIGDTLVITYEVDVETPYAVMNLKRNKEFTQDVIGGPFYGIGKGQEFFFGDEDYSNYDTTTITGGVVKGTYDAAAKTGTFEVLMKLMGAGATGVFFQHNYWAEKPNDTATPKTKIAENSEYKIRFTKVVNLTSEEEVECECTGPGNCICDPDECDCEACEPTEGFPPEFTDAKIMSMTDPKQWSIDAADEIGTGAADFIVIATIGGGSGDGFSGLQLQLQGAGDTGDTTKIGWDYVSFAHTAEEIVYIVIDLSKFASYDDVKGDSGWKQFRINYGEAQLGEYQAYYVTKALTKPATGAADCPNDSDFGNEDGTIFGWICRDAGLTPAP